jgi:ribosomal protein S7
MTVYLKKKIINHILKNGNKKTCEIIVFKSFKRLQKLSNKPLKKVLKLAVKNSAPIFRIVTLRKKKIKKNKKKPDKKVPTFVTKDFERISWGLKYMVRSAKKLALTNFYKNLSSELVSTAKNYSESITFKKELQQEAVINERFLLNFRW